MIEKAIVLATLISAVLATGYAHGGGCRHAVSYSQPFKAVKQLAYVQPYQQVVKQNISYFVGAPLRYEASLANYENEQVAMGQVSRELERLTARLGELQQYQTQQRQLGYGQPYGYAQPPAYQQPYQQPYQQQQAYVQPQTSCQQCQGGQAAQTACPNCQGSAPPVTPFSRTTPNGQHQGMVSSTCVQCHSGAQPKGGFSMDRGLSYEDKMRAMDQVLQGNMPPDNPLTEEQEFQLFRELKLSQEMGQGPGQPGEANGTGTLPPPPPQQQLEGGIP